MRTGRLGRGLALVALTLAGGAASLPAHADTMTWKVRSFSRYAVDVAFYSRNRNHVWPSTTTAYIIRDFNVATYKLSCVAGESICYGAGVKGNLSNYWGAGIGGKQGCKSCCFTCNGDTVTPIMNLNER